MRIERTILAALAILTLGAGRAKAEEPPLVLVENGGARAVVIMQKGCPPKTKWKNYYTPTPYFYFERKVLCGARDIAAYLGKMSGTEVRLINEGEPIPDGVKVRIYVGHTEAAEKAGVEFPSGCDTTPREDLWEEEGYVVKTKGGNIYIGGNQDGDYIGTAYGCYAFLKKLGCRWYFPGEWGEVIPKRTTISVPPLDLKSSPDFAVRDLGYSGWVKFSKEESREFAAFCIRNGFNPGHRFYPPANDGSMGALLPTKEYAKDHPDYYAMRKDGTRPEKGAGMYCLSNPEVLKESIRNLKLHWDGKKNLSRLVKPYGVGLSPKDGAPFCFCKECKQMNHRFDYPAYVRLPMISELHYGFIAKLARAFPDKIINTAAYSLREAPPQGVDLPDNVAIQYAPISCDVLHPANHPKSWRRQEMWSMLKQFRRQTPHVYMSDYNPGLLLGYFVPERKAENMAANVPMYKQLDLKGNLIEGRKAVMQTWLSYYLTGALLWDADADVEQLKREFYDSFFGAAGPPVRAWWDTIAETLVNADIQAHEDWLLTHIYTVPYTRELHKHVDAARKAATQEPYKGRVEAFALIADHLEAYAAMHEAEKNMDYPAALAAAKHMMADKMKLKAIYSHFIHEKMAYGKGFTNSGRIDELPALIAKLDGTKGELVARIPMEARFCRDRFNTGVLSEWYAPDFDDSQWETRNTYYLWDQQEEPLTPAGNDYDGYGWYRMKVQIPARFKGRELRLWVGGVINEGWVWVNGGYAGHRPHKLWWSSPHEFEKDVSALIKPGETNLITIRVYNNGDVGGMYRRGFLYAPVEGVDAE